jgi:hypothetical protein
VSLSSEGFLLVCFFIAFPFSPCCSSGTYDSDPILPLCVRYHEQLHPVRHADIDKAIFRIGVIRVEIVIESPSRNTVVASSKETPCSFRLGQP